MALIKCPECDKEISDKASACPNCGCPINDSSSNVKFVAAKCPSCGANINVDQNDNKTKCNYCHSTIIVDDAIKRYQIEISGKVEVSNLPTVENYLLNGSRYYDNNDYEEAYRQYNKVIEINPNNFLAILRNGICKSLYTRKYDYNINPLHNGIRQARDILNKNKEESTDINYNKIASEGFRAAKLMEECAKNFYNKDCNYRDMLDNFQMLFDCIFIYADCEKIAKDSNLKICILKSVVDLADYMIVGRNYRTGKYRNNQEIIKTFFPPSSVEKNLYSIRNEAVEEYNSLVNPDEYLKIKKQPLIRLNSSDSRAVSIIVVFIIIYLLFLLFSI